MKKLMAAFIAVIVLLTFLSSKSLAQDKSDASQKTISQKIIRFHVIANSDSTEDQNLKLKVRDKVLSYISPKLSNCTSIDESRKLLKQNDADILNIARSTIKENGYKYGVVTSLSNENFPVKSYGNITLPQGNYEAYRIIIGSGSGHNWWCVMFPPLCFIDVSKGEVSEKKTETEMRRVLNDDEYKLVDTGSDKDTGDIKIKFKFLEIFDDIFGKKTAN